LRSLAVHNILGGFDLGRDYPELGNALLVCATEKRTAEEIDAFASRLEQIIASQD
jgi:glycine dehydrogenase subunit 1